VERSLRKRTCLPLLSFLGISVSTRRVSGTGGGGGEGGREEERVEMSDYEAKF